MKKIFTLLLMLCSLNLFSQSIYYVKSSGNDANNGTSWTTAFKTLQKAINTITTGEIWVAAGTYYPDEGAGQTDNNRGSCFTLKTNVAIYGGFAGTETLLNQRNLRFNITRLSGDLLKNDASNFVNTGENAYHVIKSNNITGTLLDGFTITGGNASSYPNDHGGGITIYRSSLTITNCRFIENTAYKYGGAIFNQEASLTIINSSFIGNRCTFEDGGALFNNGYSDENGSYLSTAMLTNCSFASNSSFGRGGAVFSGDYYSKVTITNCILWGNSSRSTTSGNYQIDNVSGRSLPVTYSLVQGGYPGIGNLSADPLFVNAATGDLHLLFCSPAIDTGNNAAVTGSIDGDGLPRIVNNKIDMGAYESQESRILYVNAVATGNRTGHSWTNAFTYLQDALAVGAGCQSPVEIWVAAGTYYPDLSSVANTNDPMASFVLKNSVAIYGGFAGTETERNQRNWGTNTTILSGDVDAVAGNAGNSIHVVRSTGVNSTAILDGFTITGGNASGTSVLGEGGGMYNDGASPTVANCYFLQNTAAFLGAGLYNKNSSPIITGCSFIENTADISGGGIYNESSSPTLTSCDFYYNSAFHYGGGGGIYNESSSPVITLCSFSVNRGLRGGGIANFGSSAPLISQSSFSDNRASSEGGGMFSQLSAPQMTNCSFARNTALKGGGLNNYYSPAILMNCSLSQNTATEGGALYNNNSAPTITNSIIWDNSGGEITNLSSTPIVTYSIVKDGYSGTGNLDADPMFTVDLNLKGCSPAINSASPAGAPAIDMIGNIRPVLGGYDMGAFEFQSSGRSTVLYVDQKSNGRNDGTSWTNAYTNLQDALNKAGSCYSPTQVWVAAGTYYPDQGTGITNNDRNASFIMRNNVTVYAGFSGTEMDLTQRNWKVNTTILSGDIDHETNATDNGGNAYHVISAREVDSSAVLDGFTIMGGNANGNGAYPENSDRGGGILVYNSSPAITNCIIRSNNALSFGGGVANIYSYNLLLNNCLFYDNGAKWGGGIANYDYANSTVIHCSFSNNRANQGGAIYNMNALPWVTNSILWGNTGGQVAAARGAFITYSLLQDGYYPDGHNLQTDPLFVNQATGDLHLQACSPAIDAGNQMEALSTTDLDGDPRTVVIQTDMGAYEFQGTAIYVKKDATGRANGTSWANAYTSLQDALAQPTGCSHLVTIWVAKGEYHPDEGAGLTNNDRTASFRLKNNTAVLGGFSGTENSLAERSPASARYNQTILSGEIDGLTGNAGNAYHVVRAENVDTSAVLEGFTISGGNANGSTAPINGGGGLYNNASPTIRYCLFNANTGTNGGAVYNTSAAAFLNCRFILNKATYGGAFYNQSASPSIINGLFWKNQASQGGTIYNTTASPHIINGSFNSNTASSGFGGAIRNVSASMPTITNCILWGDAGGEISNASSTPIVSYCLVQGGYAAGSYIINADPRFADEITGKLSLTKFPVISPCIDAGNNAEVMLTTDVNGDQRIYNGIVDMGADEFYPGGIGGPEPLVLISPDNFTLPSDVNSCGTIADFSGDHAATTKGGAPPVTITYDPAPGTMLPVGDVLVIVSAKDVYRTQTSSFWVTVVDGIPPVITDLVATPSVLYPPNHKMQDLTIAYNVTDNCPGVNTTLSVTSNESQYGTGSGDTGPDWQIIDEHHIRLRAERSGNGTGRIYTITITATDVAGNTTTATTTVSVPHDNRIGVTTTQRTIGKEELINGLKVQALPNPTSDGFTVITQSSSAQTLSIQVMDNLGRVVEKRTGVSGNGTIYLGSHYLPGMYFMKIVQGDAMQTLRLLKKTR